jgi:hypothetical protein
MQVEPQLRDKVGVALHQPVPERSPVLRPLPMIAVIATPAAGSEHCTDLLTLASGKRVCDVVCWATVPMPSSQIPLLLRIVRDGSSGFIAITGPHER